MKLPTSQENEATGSNLPLVSVLIPVFNRPDVVHRAIRSAFSQDYCSLEIIVVDDGSTDRTVQTVVDLSASFPLVLITHSTNRGEAAALNAGIDAARGEYVAFLDSDDEWRPDKVRRQVEAILATDDPSNTLCYTQLIIRNGRDDILWWPRAKRSTESVGDYFFLSQGLMQTSSLLLSTRLAATVRFRDDLRFHTDWDLCLRLEQRGVHFCMVEEPLTIWYKDDRPDRVSGKTTSEQSLRWLEEVRRLLSLEAYRARRLALASGLSRRDRGLALKILRDALESNLIHRRRALFLALEVVSPPAARWLSKFTEWRRSIFRKPEK